MTQLTQEEEKFKQAQKKEIIEVWRGQYREKQKEEDYSDYSNELLKCFQLLNTGYSLEAGTLSENLTASDRRRYICFIKNNMERLKGVTRRRFEREREELIIPVVTID